MRTLITTSILLLLTAFRLSAQTPAGTPTRAELEKELEAQKAEGQEPDSEGGEQAA